MVQELGTSSDIDKAINACQRGETAKLRNVVTSDDIRFTIILRPYTLEIDHITYSGIHLEAWQIADGFKDLTENQMIVVGMLAHGWQQTEIAKHLGITERAVGERLGRAASLTSSDRRTVALLALHQGLLQDYLRRNL